MKKKLTIIIVIAIIAALGIAYALLKPEKQPEYTTHTVERGLLEQTVDATGKVESADRIELNFNITGTVTEINVETGQKVEQGDTLAMLDALTLESKVADARAKVSQARADYDKILAGASDQDIKVAEDNVAQKLQNLIAEKNDLASIKTSKATELSNLKDTALTVIRNELNTARGAMDEVDNTLNDPEAESTLSAEDSELLSTTQENEKNANDAIQSNDQTNNTMSVNSTDQDVLGAIDETKDTLSLVALSLSNTLAVLGATPISGTFTETELDALKTNIKAQQVKINTAQTNVQTAKTNWTNKIAYFEDLIQEQEDAITSAERALSKAESELALKKSPPRQFEIDAARAKLEQAQASLALANAQRSDAIIEAPISGTIIKKNYEIGEKTELTTPMFEMIGESTLQIEVDIPESDIAKVSLGQHTEITLDAFSDQEIFSGTITFIEPAETVIQDVVYYRLKVQFDELDDRVKSGMTANVTIVSESKEDVLWAPSRAVKKRNGDRYVEILTNGIVNEQTVTTGMKGDLGLEITSGLSGGEEVVTFVKEE